MPTKTRKATPAKRARARRDPAIFRPPPRVRGTRTSSLENLHLRARGRTYPVGVNIEGDTPWSLGMDQTGTVQLPVRDPSGRLPRVLDDEQLLHQEGVRCVIDGVVYCVQGMDHDGSGLYTLTLEDEVSWTLKLFTSFKTASRKRITRFGFIQSFVDEASRKPLARMRSFIPEVDDPRPIRALARQDAPASRSSDSVDHGTGSGEYKVKGKRATARQRGVIDGALGQAKEDGASRRVMVALVMALTQESRAGEDTQTTGNDDTGLLQQGRNWISVQGAKDPAKATHAFLVTGPTSWKKVHGGLKHAPGDLESAIKRVQGSVGGYAQWKAEATATVAAWLDEGGGGDESYVERYSFSRGERGGQRENSWDAAARLVEEVGAFRWAAANVFYAVSGNELRHGAPALTIDGTEGFLRSEPKWSVSAGRSVSEVTLEVLADRWDVMPGGMVVLHRELGMPSGRWEVWNVSGPSLDSPEATVVLHRPTRLKSEPASETASHEEDDGGGEKTADKLRSVCKDISDGRASYVYGGGHGPPIKNVKKTDHMDCSSSVSLALHLAGFYPGERPAYVSGDFAAKWGKPGKGDEFTVWANGEHVWLEFHDGDRFDTSQHSGDSGPAYSTVKRSDQERFTARHYPGH